MGVPCTSTDGDSYFAAVAESYDRLQPVLSPPYENGLGMIVDLIPFEHDAEGLMRRMAEAGFNEVSVAWRMFADTILVA